jgi:hypothetical protein
MSFPDLIPKDEKHYGVVSYRAFMVVVLTFCAWQATEILAEIKQTAKLANTLNSRLDAQAERLIVLDSRIGRLENPYFINPNFKN